uniref:Uncharacterized protein n=1 Tax=Arundo donax TaxID=35708 RepID=A0A0A9F5G0_ARUDO
MPPWTLKSQCRGTLVHGGAADGPQTPGASPRSPRTRRRRRRRAGPWRTSRGGANAGRARTPARPPPPAGSQGCARGRRPGGRLFPRRRLQAAPLACPLRPFRPEAFRRTGYGRRRCRLPEAAADAAAPMSSSPLWPGRAFLQRRSAGEVGWAAEGRQG